MNPQQTQNRSLLTLDAYISLVVGFIVVLIVGWILFRFISSRNQPTQTADEQNAAESTKDDTQSKTYTVKSGDTLWSIAEVTLKSGYNWVDIAKANNLADSNTIEVGQQLTIPSVAPIQVGDITATGATQQAPPKTYTVERDDTLWTIAEKFYQSGYKWVDIAKANNLTEPNLIFSGNVLTLP